MAIQLSNASIRAVLQRLGRSEPEPHRTHLLAVRSASRHSPNSVSLHAAQSNRYDDVVIVWGSFFGIFTATVDPGRTYTLQPMNPSGCAHLANGTYLYEHGLHKGKPALRPVGSIRIWRDRDRDGQQDPAEIVKTVDGKGVGVNLHRGGNAPTVDSWSAGCVAVPVSGHQWAGFWTLLEQSGQSRYRLDVIDGADLLP